mmetsp:Transcript_32160/g.49171  ORF Transcript_32160/g.49171 Transcript_32160/m.49171 type:complete len:251 (+) Transcript_32160:1-753(+)
MQQQQQQQQQAEDTTSTKIQTVTLCNPGNPTGVSLSKTKVLERASELCKQYGAWLILDCTYEHFEHTSTDNSMFTTCIDHEPHVLHVFSFSKGYAMAGFRCGYLTTTSEHVYNQMLKVQDSIPICPSRVSQIAALGALQTQRQWVNEKVATLDTGRRAILDALDPLDVVMGGTGAMYLMAKLPATSSDDREVARMLVEKYGVAVIPGSFCGFPGWIRVCYSNLPPETCIEAAERLGNGIRSICSDSQQET